jgi:hypothetical protein
MRERGSVSLSPTPTDSALAGDAPNVGCRTQESSVKRRAAITSDLFPYSGGSHRSYECGRSLCTRKSRFLSLFLGDQRLL